MSFFIPLRYCILYCGSDDTITLSGNIGDEGSGFGALGFVRSGIQNGPNDGLALLNATSEVVQFLFYEGKSTDYCTEVVKMRGWSHLERVHKSMKAACSGMGSI